MKTLGILVLLVLAVSCGKISEGPLVFSERLSINQAALTDIAGFLNTKNCQTCHAWVNNPAELLTRIKPGAPGASSVYTRVLDGTMPKDGTPLTTAELEILSNYILALNNPPVVVPPASGFALVKPIFDAKCVACHTGLKEEATIPGRWLVKGDADASKLYTAVANGSMPKWYPENTAAELTIVSDYIHDLGKPDPKVNFQQLFDGVLKAKCVKCHKGFDKEEGISWAVKAGEPANSRLYIAMENGSMPKRLPKATDGDLAVLRNYINELRQPAQTTSPNL